SVYRQAERLEGGTMPRFPRSVKVDLDPCLKGALRRCRTGPGLYDVLRVQLPEDAPHVQESPDEEERLRHEHEEGHEVRRGVDHEQRGDDERDDGSGGRDGEVHSGALMRRAYSRLPGVRSPGLGCARPWQLRQVI